LPDFALLNPGYISTSLVTTGPSRSEAFARYDRADASEGEGPLVHADVRAAWIAGSFDTKTALRAWCPAMTTQLPHPEVPARSAGLEGCQPRSQSSILRGTPSACASG